MSSSGTTRNRFGKAASSAAATVEKIAVDRKSYSGTAKDASHAAFYAGLGKGFVSAMNGFVLFLSRDDLRQRLKDSMALIANAQIGYAVLAAAAYFFLRDPADNLSQLLWSLSQWARIVTIIVTLFFERKVKATEAMFLDSLSAVNPRFASSIKGKERVKPGTREKLRKYKRLAKMTAIRVAGFFVSKFLPGGQVVAVPVLKYISVRSTLGAPVSLAVAALHAIPADWLASSHFDDLLLQFTEAVIDAEDLGSDVMRPYTKHLDAKTREYVTERYRGYITGLGLCYSVLQAVPFLGIPVILVAETGAAVAVVDIATRNLSKENRLPLVGEDALRATE